MNKIKPIFIISLPRTGSTLIQRILMGHSKISSVAEPHFLLPFIYATKQNGTLTNYSHYGAHKGFKDVLKNLPNGEIDYYQFLNEFSVKIYSSLSNSNSIYFLDKTPRYFWIIPEIEKIFPNAKFIFLFRNPVQVFASTISTFSDNRFHKLYRFHYGLDEGFNLISKGFEKLKSKAYAIQYEKFIENPEHYLTEILDYLDLNYESNLLSNFNKQDLKGASVDPTGVKLYKSIDDSPLEKWKTIFNSNYRKKILNNYIDNLDNDSLLIQGYDKQKIKSEINNLKTNGKHKLFHDILDYNRSLLIEKYKLNLLFSNKMKWADKQFLS